MLRNHLLCALVLAVAAGHALAQSGGQTLYNGIALPAQWPPIETPNQNYNLPTYIGNPPAVIPIDTGRQLFVDDFLIQQTTMVRTRHRPVMYPLNPIITPDQNDTGGFAMPFSGGAWFDPSAQLYKLFIFCGGAPAKLCYDYSTDGIHWTRPFLPNALVPNTDQVLPTALTVWMDQHDPNPANKFKAFVYDPNSTDHPVLLWLSPDGIQWTSTNDTQYPIALVYDRTSLFWNPFRDVWVDSMKNYLTVPSTPARAPYLTRLRNYAESPDLMNWTPLEPANFGTSFWTGPDVNDPPYVAGGTFPQLYNLDAVGYESVMVGLFSWYYPGFDDDNPANLPGPDLVELGVGFSRDGFQWVRPTRGSGPGPNGAFIPATNVAGTWNMGNTQSAGGGFLVVGDQLWFYFSGFNGLHGDPNAMASTGLATLRRDGFYSMDAGSTPAVLTTRPVQFSGKYLFVNVTDPQGSLQIQVLNPTTSAVLATSLPLSADKTLQAVSWNGLPDLSSFANQPVEFQFTLTNGELYSFWVSASTSGASNGYVAAGGPGFTGPTDNLGAGAYPTIAATPIIYPNGGIVSSATNITLSSGTLGATINYTLDGSNPQASSPVYSGPIHLSSNATVTAVAYAPGLTHSSIVSANFTIDNSPPLVSITSPTNNQTISAGISLSANASDSLVGVAGVQFLLDGVPVGTVASAPYTISVQTTTLTNASHQITAIATNNIGTIATSTPVTVTVQNVFTGPTVGLVGYWSFDSAYVSGATLFDQSGYNNNATAISALSVPGPVGQALHFDGSSSYVQVTSSLAAQQVYDLVGDLSLSLLIQTTNSSRTETLITKLASGGAGSGYILRTTSLGTVQLAFGVSNIAGGSNVATDVTKINDGNWHRVIAVIKLGTSVTFYIDGQFSSTYTMNSVAGTASTFLQFGLDPYPPNGTYFTGNMDEVRVYNRALSGSDVIALGGGALNVPPPAGSASFVATDTSTQGNWTGMYGQNGYIIPNDSNNSPSYATVNFSGANSYTWTTSTSDPRALLAGSGNGRIASAYYATSGFTIDVNFTDGLEHRLALYCLDWDNTQRSETISILDAGTEAVLDRRTISNFSAGEYLVWNILGNVLITVTSTAGPNAVVSGLFFDPLPGPDLTIKKTHTGNFTPGDIGDTYTITVSNSGSNPTTGSVMVTDTLPQGLTATGITGVGWACTAPFGPCSRSDVLGPGASYNPITLTVNVASNAPSSVTNTATVSGGGESDSSNNTASDQTTIATQSNAKTFVTGYALDSPVLRNNFSGWVGMELTVGANPLTVTSLGRICIAGNSGSHVVKFTNASNATDVPGGSVTVNMSGCTAGKFVFTALSGSVTLQPGTAYYLASQESAAGDQWYDHGALTPTGDAAVNSSIYSADSATWTAAYNANSAYVPPNFSYLVTAPTTIPVTVQTTPGNLSITVDGTTYSTSQVFNWIAGSSHTIAATSPQSAPAGTQYVWTNWSDNGALSHIVAPSAAITFTADFATQYLLSAGVSGSGGVVTLNPTSTSGYYNSGTNVQLTAVPNTGCTFTNWSGSVSGSFSPLTITMTAAQSVTASFQCGAPTTSFLTGYALNQPVVRNDFTGWVGMALTTASNSLSVASLGRACLAGNSGTHSVKLVSAAGTDVAGGSVSVNMAGCVAGQFMYTSLASPVTLQANTTYYLASQELLGADQWYDHGAVSSTTAAAVTNAIYSPDSATWIAAGGTATSYVPPNMLYSIVAAPPDLTILKSHTATFTQGDVGDTYSITVSNIGGSPTTAPVSVADTIPTGLVATAVSGTGWTCTQPAGPCSRSDALNNGLSYLPITVTVNVASNAPSSVINVATVSGGGETNTANDSASDTTSIKQLVPPDLTILKNHTGTFTQGDIGDPYSITVSNIGGSPTTAPVSVADTIPTGLVATAISGTGWTCTQPAGPCSRSDALNNGLSYLPITVTVNVAGNAPSSVINVATVSGGGETITTNDSASDTTTIKVPPDLTILKSHTATFTQGDVGDTYSITVSNIGGSPTTAPVSVADTIPTGLVAAAVSGTGWTCTQPAGPCSRSDALNNGLSYLPITVTVNVASNAPSTVINAATVSGGGETNTANDSASDTTSIRQIVPITVQTNPTGLSFTVDGTTYSSSQGFNWIAGSSHSIATTSPQSGGAGIQYVWSGWSDAGAISHSVSPTSAATLTATFGVQYLLTASVSPSGAGTIAANPVSGTGYYASGTQVQLTATPTSNYAFSNWSGGLTGSTNPQTITMSAPQSTTANFQLLSTAITAFAQNASASRNNFTGWVGTSFTVNANPLGVASFGRVCVAGNSGSHNVKFVQASTGIDVPGGSAVVNMAGCTAGQFAYASVTVTLQPNVTYYLVSQELMGGDNWYDFGSVTPSGDVTLNGALYLNGANWVQAGVGNSSYVPPNFKYLVLPAPPSPRFVTDYNLNLQAPRNNFTGFVGMQFTVAASPRTISSLGRVCLAGNSGTHTVQVVNVNTGAVVPGAVASLNMSGCTAGQFVFTALQGPVTLLANTAYYLVSQEVSGGDQWYDYGTVSTTTAAAVTNSVYSSDGINWATTGGANTSYVPPNFQ